jgi:hypothetical protein
MKSELVSKTPTCLLALSITAEFIIAFIERTKLRFLLKENKTVISSLNENKTALSFNTKKTKLLRSPIH